MSGNAEVRATAARPGVCFSDVQRILVLIGPDGGNVMKASSVLRRMIPTSCWRSLRAYVQRHRNLRRASLNFGYDEQRFLDHASPFRDLENEEQLRSYIVMLSHGIEKGLALPSPRPNFGADRIHLLIDSITRYLRSYPADPLVSAAIAALEAYALFNSENGQNTSVLAAQIDGLRSATHGSPEVPTRLQAQPDVQGGIRELSAATIRDASNIELAQFFEHRFSVRQYARRRVEIELITEAIRMAQKTPSVCNRQSVRVHVFTNDDLGRRVLNCQQGNRGFGADADKILVVTSELGSFLSVGERNQCWIDGGMFAMSLIYALHSKGLGTCCLNWSVEREVDQKLREVAGIKVSESVIMLIAVGHLPERLRVAFSARKPLDQVVKFHCLTEATGQVGKGLSQVDEGDGCAHSN